MLWTKVYSVGDKGIQCWGQRYIVLGTKVYSVVDKGMIGEKDKGVGKRV